MMYTVLGFLWTMLPVEGCYCVDNRNSALCLYIGCRDFVYTTTSGTNKLIRLTYDEIGRHIESIWD